MRKCIDIPFKVGDKVWHKNLVTNEAIQTTVKYYTAVINADGSKCIMFHLTDNSMCVNIVGTHKNTDVFATKKECDSYPPYIPE